MYIINIRTYIKRGYLVKRALLNSTLALTLALTFAGCSGDPEPDKNSLCIIDQVDAPKWVCGIVPSYNDMYTDVGSAKISQAGVGFSRKNAIADARSNLAQQIQTEVKSKIEQYAQSTGIGKDARVDKVLTQISKQVSKVSLSRSKQLAYWKHPKNNNVYILMGIPKNSVNDSIDKVVRSNFKNENILWQQFKAENTLSALDKDTKDK